MQFACISILFLGWSTQPGACARLPHAGVVRAAKRTNWLRGFVTRDKTMKRLANSNRPVVNQANAFDSRLRGSRSTASIPSPVHVNELSVGVLRSLSGLVDRQSRKLPPASICPLVLRPMQFASPKGIAKVFGLHCKCLPEKERNNE